MARSRVVKAVCFSLFRILLPLTLLAAAVVRFNAVSFTYLVCLLFTPLLPYPSLGFLNGKTGWFLKALIVLSALPVLTHIVFHIVLVAIATHSEPYGSMFPNCSANEKLVRQIGFQRLDGVPFEQGVRLILPDVVVLAVSIVVLVIPAVLVSREAEQADLPQTARSIRRRKRLQSVMNFIGESFVTILLATCGIMVPSVLSSVYFLLFLLLAVLWSCYLSLGRGFTYLRVVLLFYTGAHILLLHLYQFQFFQDFVPPEGLIARLVGLTGLVYTDCSRVHEVAFHPDVKWMMFVNPGVLLLLYWVLACETRYWLTIKDLSPDELMDASEAVSVKNRRKKRRRPANTERQVAAGKDLDETGSLVFSGSTYGDEDDGDEECLVDEGENLNYNSMATPEGEPQAGPSGRQDPLSSGSNMDAAQSSRKESKRPWIVSILMFVMKQSYVLMLIAMMAWSIVYHSWLTFVLLLGACILWMLPNSRRACLVTSPVVVLYAVCLLIAQYIFNMSLRELPQRAGEVTVKEIGLQHFDIPPKDLALHILFTLFFFMTLRQFMRERRVAAERLDPSNNYQLEAQERRLSREGIADILNLGFPPDTVDAYDGYSIRVLGRFFMETMCKYWIFVCAGMLLLIAVQEVVIYRIIYMILFLLFVLCFQVSYTLWRLLMFAFWWLVILYSMVVLITIYTFQFEQFPGYWMNNTGWDNQTLLDIGLEKFSGTELFIKLLTPTSFLIVIILQVHYFHKPFLRLSALDRYKKEDEMDQDNTYRRWLEHRGTHLSDVEPDEDPKRPSNVRALSAWVKQVLLQKVLLRLMEFWETLTQFLWRLAEIHIFKLVVIIIMAVSTRTEELSAVTAVYVILVALLLPFVLTKAHLLLSHLAVLWTCIIILAKMMFQLRMVPEDGLLTSCPNGTNSSIEPLPPKSLDNSVWFGFRKLYRLGFGIDTYIRLYILILVAVLFESIIRYHQQQHFNRPDKERPAEGIIFHKIHREDADKGILPCIKFFANYAFYKFGLEICYIASAVTVAVRMDVVAVIYAVLLAVMMLFSRRASSRVWWLYMIILAILLPVQFLVALGFPPVACIVYPWEGTDFKSELELWLYLPDLVHPPSTTALMADVIQLLFVCLQWKVFRLEIAAQGTDSGGGSNEEILPEVEANTKIPVEDFTIETKSYMDVIKQAVFEYMFWVTLAIIFIAGAARINIFGMGYVIAVFCFMWYGKEFLLKPLRKLLRMWNFLIAYCVFVFFAKACLQLVGCVYIDHLLDDTCWVIQLFGISCHLSIQDSIIQRAEDTGCVIEPDNTGLSWDVVCFTFLLLQRRIYSCHYFRHVVDLLYAQSRLSSRGAELINRILVREVARQKEQEKQILIGIKKKMAALKEKQSKVLKDYKEPEDHFQAIRAGDYYLFDEDVVLESDLDRDQGQRPPDSLTFGSDPHTDKEKRMGPLQVISTAVDQGTDVAVEKVKSQDDHDVSSREVSVSKVKAIGNFISALISSMADWLIHLCNKISRNYRLVAHKLDQELKLEKEKIQSRYKPPASSPLEMSVLDLSSGTHGSTSNPSYTPDDIEQPTGQVSVWFDRQQILSALPSHPPPPPHGI
ncbi:hypothetical protein BaRGS_00025714 [Batillaria attramentaria]|uniref:Piezo-type mechanosensitive ion channel component n=1 Tax=Batillaria attramentaria TaxID=370345 RepID=A0ABD0K6V0_9CAEN